MTRKNVIKKTLIILSINYQYFMSEPYFLAHRVFELQVLEMLLQKIKYMEKKIILPKKNYNSKLKNWCFKPLFWVQSDSYNV